MKFRPRTGKEVENLVEHICTGMFLSDFVVRSPIHRKTKGKEIEIADLIVPFGETLVAFQVKSKYEPKRASQKSEVDFQRINKVIQTAIKQLKTVKRAIRNNWLDKFQTVRGIIIKVDGLLIESLIGIVVIDLVGEEILPREERTSLFSSFTYQYGMPIHVFFRDEFLAISQELDTLPDFLRFLSKTKQLYEKRLFVLPPTTLDLLAFYKMDPDQVDNIIETDTRVYIEDGFWHRYNRDHIESIRQRDELNKPSYLIDGIIDYLHSSVGYQLTSHELERLDFKGQGTVEGYLTIAKELASISRLERRYLGEKLLKCLRVSEKKGRSFSVLVLEENRIGYVVLAQSGERSSRQQFLFSLCAMAYCSMGLEKIIGIATEPLTGEGRSYDTIGLANVSFENAEELVAEAKNYFNAPHKPGGTEYTPSDNLDT